MIMVSRLMLKPIKLPIKAITWWFGGPMVANAMVANKIILRVPNYTGQPPLDWSAVNHHWIKVVPSQSFAGRPCRPKLPAGVNQEKDCNSFKNITFLLPQGLARVAQAHHIHLPYPPSWCQDHLSLQFCTLCWEHICKKTICDKSPSIQTHDCRSFSTQVISESPIWRAIWSGHNIVDFLC